MRKRMIALLAAVCMVCSPVMTMAEEEEFTLHNGVKFGMSLSEIKSTEKEAGCTVTTTDEIFEDRPLIAGTVAGIDNSVIFFAFDDESLFNVSYSFRGHQYSTSQTQQIDEYGIIQESLIEKYGEPSFTYDEGNGIFDNGEYKGEYITGLAYANYFGHTPLDYEQWLLPQKDGTAVLIDHSITQSPRGSVSHHIDYTLIDSDSVASIVDKKEERNNDL